MKLDTSTRKKSNESSSSRDKILCASNASEACGQETSTTAKTKNRLSIRGSGRQSLSSSLRVNLKASRMKQSKLRLNKSTLDEQTVEQIRSAPVRLSRVTRSLASEALEALRTTVKPVTVTIENLNDVEVVETDKIKSEPLDSTSQARQKNEATASKLLGKSLFKNLNQRNNQKKTNDLILRSASLEQIPTAQTKNSLESKETQATLKNDPIRELYFKISFLNSCGSLSDFDYDFLVSSLPKHAPKSSLHPIDPSNHDLKHSINKSIADLIDSKTVLKIVASPFYSLSLRLDSDGLSIFVSVHYIDNSQTALDASSNHDSKYLIKLLNFKQFSQNAQSQPFSAPCNLFPAKLSKHLIEQLRNNVLNKYNLDKKNLMCISLDTLILERLCFPTFEFYLNEFIHDCVLVVPSFCAVKTLKNFLASVEETKCLRDNIALANDLIDYLRSNDSLDETLSDLFEIGNIARLSECLLDKYLPTTILILQNIYLNYSFILEKLAQTNKPLYEAINTIDFYYITCLMYDLSGFLFDYMLYTKRFTSYANLKMPWNLKGSVLNNLLNEQIAANNGTPTSNDLLICSTTDKPVQAACRVEQTELETNANSTSNLNITINNKKSTIEFETHQLDHLHKLKELIEKKSQANFDFSSSNSPMRLKYSYLAKSKLDDGDENSVQACDDTTSISMLEIYSSLCQMFDFSFFKIKKKSTGSKCQIELELAEAQLQNILNFYKFNLYTNLNQFKNEYLKFYDKFFKLNLTLIESKENEIKRDTLYELTILSDIELKTSFLKFVSECYATKFCLIICTLVNIYLTLPPLVEFQELNGLSAGDHMQSDITNQSTSSTQQDITCFEYKSKLIEAYKSQAHLNSLIEFNDL